MTLYLLITLLRLKDGTQMKLDFGVNRGESRAPIKQFYGCLMLHHRTAWLERGKKSFETAVLPLVLWLSIQFQIHLIMVRMYHNIKEVTSN